jgi:asparagine synthase (glutamine-hydrolysing)
MCGIAGYIGKKTLEDNRLDGCLLKMSNRGPDFRAARIFDHNETHTYLLHSRLSIIDLDSRSNQPYSFENLHIIFNGEVYNYIEVREELKRQGYHFITDSDTEVLIKAFHCWNTAMFSRLEGMWAFAIYDDQTGKLLLSRDRFAEKPLFVYKTVDGIYFGSEIKFIKALSGVTLEINDAQVFRYLVNGYKSLYKTTQNFYKHIDEVIFSGFMIIDTRLSCIEKKYWSLQSNINQNLTLEDAVEGVRERLLGSVKLRLRADVPLAFCLSGGIDSASLASIAAKEFNYNVSTFSIIDTDARYNEFENIDATIKDIDCEHTLIHLSNGDDFRTRLKNLIAYHDSPIATISYLIHSMLSEQIAAKGYKVAISGTAADELLTGYYDHFNLQLYCLSGTPYYPKHLKDWEEHIKPIVRNPYLQQPDLYVGNESVRDHIYLDNIEFEKLMVAPFHENFIEEKYANNLLHNRMMNELFHEGSRVILHEDDLNSMFYSIENRSPFLDTALAEFSYSIPVEYLIDNGYGKNVLRQSLKGILNDKVRLDRKKKGFNASISSLFDFNDRSIMEEMMDRGKAFDYVDRNKIEPFFYQETKPNSISKFLFNFINIKYFLELNG